MPRTRPGLQPSVRDAAGRPARDSFEYGQCRRFRRLGDGHTLNTAAFADAIAALAARGGGRVVVPEGVWYTGPIELKDNTELHLEQNAVIVFSDDKTLYPLVETTFEGLNTLRCQSPISARGVKNVAITGRGVIDGQRRCVARREAGQTQPPPVEDAGQKRGRALRRRQDVVSFGKL